MTDTALFTNDAIILGILFTVLGLIFYTSELKGGFWQKFYRYIPSLLLCYFIPGFLNTFGVIDGHHSKLYFVASRYLLPACLVLLTLSVDLKGILRLGPKAIIIFLTGSIGIIIGGPIAILIVKNLFPNIIEGLDVNELWRGMTTVAGSWIGGGANQASMKEVFSVEDKVFSIMVVIDVLVASMWMAVLLFLAPKAREFDNKTGADTKAIEQLKQKMESFSKKVSTIPTTTNLMIICAIAFGVTAFSHFIADNIAPFIKVNYPALAKFSLTSKFFWLIVIATTIGVSLSFTKARKLEGYGASKLANIFLYVLIASIGMHMNVFEILKWPGAFLIGLIWMFIHALLMLIVGKLIKAPLFFIAVGSQANVGGAASAPVVASVFHHSLAPVGVLLAVLGYVIGTYGAWICGQLMRIAAQY
ncbi:MAG: DUF819 family protein [Bacteriovoracaceae bacterium]|jgi:uncharacterized membrane protein|nr:DUF819 family protein [Bacteriovoracaceae bacterium]